MSKEVISTKLLQRAMKNAGLYKGKIDGDYGPMTKKAVKKIQKKLKELGLYKFSIDGDYGPRTKKAVVKFQTMNPPLVPDGIAGNRTLAKLFVKLIKDRESGIELNDHDEEQDEFPLETRDQRYIRKFYGEPGSSNLVRIKLPYPMRVAWAPSKTVKSIMCHKKVAKNMKNIFKETLEHYGYDRIVELGLDLYGGCYNKRRMRGANRWSMHSWGIAFDMDPAHNQLRWHAPKARLSKSDYVPFWDIVEKNGATSLGREKDYDWMHFQFARRS